VNATAPRHPSGGPRAPSALSHLKAFIAAKVDEYAPHEIREYVEANAPLLAPAFGVDVPAIHAELARIPGDDDLARELLEEIDRIGRVRREERVQARATSAQETADRVGASARGHRGIWHLDIRTLLAGALTSRQDHLVFVLASNVEIYIPMDRLFSLARLQRRHLSAFVDEQGLHVRWPTGGLNLLAQPRARGNKFIVPLPARALAAESAA
jgi:hypothetical protein